VLLLVRGYTVWRRVRSVLVRLCLVGSGVSGLTSMGNERDAEKVLYLLTVKGGQIVQLNAESPR